MVFHHFHPKRCEQLDIVHGADAYPEVHDTDARWREVTIECSLLKMGRQRGSDGRYWRNNSLDDEAERLRLLERIADDRTLRLLGEAGVAEGWCCAELGAGAGSIARWLADRVGESGNVLVTDLDTTLLGDLQSDTHVKVQQADLTASALPSESFDLVHIRNVLMHLPEREVVLRGMIGALRPGGVLLVEEGDSFPVAAATSDVFRRTMDPLTRRWKWARLLPQRLIQLGLEEIDVFVEAEMLQGGTALAKFWHHTLRSARSLVTASGAARALVTNEDVDRTLVLLEDSNFWTPFMAVVCVTARRPFTSIAPG
jgi:ubiquinone/menaquinone biosynthesis C-methylase UbiE